MFEFDGAPMHDGDDVFVVGLGPGKVIDVKSTGFRIRVGGRTRKVSFRGIQSGESFKSVFWRNPILVDPAKNNALWTAQRKLVLAAANALASAVVGQELLVIPEPEAPEPAASNAEALQEIIAQAQDAERARLAQTANQTNVSAIGSARSAGE